MPAVILKWGMAAFATNRGLRTSAVGKWLVVSACMMMLSGCYKNECYFDYLSAIELIGTAPFESHVGRVGLLGLVRERSDFYREGNSRQSASLICSMVASLGKDGWVELPEENGRYKGCFAMRSCAEDESICSITLTKEEYYVGFIVDCRYKKKETIPGCVILSSFGRLNDFDLNEVNLVGQAR
ncbi:MAG: hypothetical protein LC637_04370 [Xanthomonadaceae bacterium]|nr:hypothetical protein [Xanthomonadaceae bacterium]